MRRFLWATPLLFILISSSARADTVSIFLAPNEFGDNFGIEQQNGATTVFVGGGTQAYFFDATGYAPGSMLGGSATVYLDFGEVQIGAASYDLDVTTGTLFMSGITLPTNGVSTFTAPVMLSFITSGIIDSTGQVFNVSGSANGEITFLQEQGFYYADDFVTTTPEPGTVVLMLIGTGLIGICLLGGRGGILARLGPRRILSKHITW